MMQSPYRALQEHFGLKEFRTSQLEIIEHILAGNNTLATLPTGSGKSLTYQLPSFLLSSLGTTVVISPLLSLIRDQVKKLQQQGISVCQIDSTLTTEERNHNLTEIKAGNIQLLYTSPETLGNPQLLEILKKIDISLVAIDEAHCYSEWGHSFRPSYLSLPLLTRAIKPHAVLALTATATRKVASDIRKAFRIKTAQHISSSPRRDNLSYTIIPCEDKQRNDELSNILAQHNHLPAIVYAMRQEQCEAIAHHLSSTGLRAKSYHAGMSTLSRKKIQDDFLDEDDKTQVIVATIAFGMGVDKSNIRSIIHYHLPKSPEGWMQESGRAGRDAQPAHTYLLACGDDVIPLTNFIRARELEESSIKRLITTLTSQGKSAVIQPYHTRVNLGMLTTTLDVLLAKLELLKISKYTHTTWRYIKMNVLYGRTFDLTDYPKTHRKALDHIMQLEDRYDLHDAPADFGINSEKLYHTLQEIKHSGECYMRFSGWQKHYNIVKQLDTDEVDSLTATIFQYHQDQLIHDELRLKEVQRISTTRSCIPVQFEKWFGIHKSELKPCNNCSSCHGEKRPTKLPRTRNKKLTSNSNLTDEQLENIQEFLVKKKKRIHTPAQLTCVLCGIGTPYIRHYRIHYHPIFGTFANHNYDDIHAYSIALLAG